MRSFVRLACCLLAAISLCAEAATAQQTQRVTEIQSNSSLFYHAIPGEPTVQVGVIGTVKLPGVYIVPTATRLDGLLAMTGGPQASIAPDVKHEITVRLFRGVDAQRQIIYSALIEDLYENPGDYPLLADGDVFVVDTKVNRTFSWRDAALILTSVSTFALAVNAIANSN